MRHPAQGAPVETVNDQRADPFNVGRNHAHTFAGLCARLASKLTAHTFCISINRLLGKAFAFPNEHKTLLSPRQRFRSGIDKGGSRLR